jgi:hypothetical protein
VQFDEVVRYGQSQPGPLAEFGCRATAMSKFLKNQICFGLSEANARIGNLDDQFLIPQLGLDFYHPLIRVINGIA